MSGPRSIIRWFNVFDEHTSTTGYPTKERADFYARHRVDRIACVPVTIHFVPGEGVQQHQEATE